MMALKYKGYQASLDINVDDKMLHGRILGIRDIVNFEGRTVDEAQAEFEKSVEEYLNVCKELGREPEKPYSGKFNVRIKPELHAKLSALAAIRHTSINSIVEEALEAEVAEHA